MFSTPPIKLSPSFQAILDELENSTDHLFITGKAGTGKSTLLNLFRRTTQKKMAVLAPTGVAALHVKGQTIHSFFRIPPKLIKSEDIQIKKGMGKLLKSLELLIIDEISMVRADVFDHIDYLLRFYRNDPRPFGGLRLILFGDLFQLPPVVSSSSERFFFQQMYASPYFFSAKVFERDFSLYLIELEEVFRQKDRIFIDILDRIRKNQAEEDDFYTLNKRYAPEITDKKGVITLSSTNAIADAINQHKLNEIDAPMRSYQAKVSGQFPESSLPADHVLSLKEGAQVMMVRNDSEGQYVNGSIGIVKELNESNIIIQLIDNLQQQEIKITAVDWEMIRYKLDAQGNIEEEVIGLFKQFPLKLAWAVTIHKSQGKTFEQVIIDLGRGAFEFGQAYVALSRCTHLEGISLKKQLRPSDIMVDERVLEFYDRIR